MSTPRPLKEIEDINTLPFKATMFADGKCKKTNRSLHWQTRCNEEFGITLSDHNDTESGEWERTICAQECPDRSFTVQEFVEYVKSLKEEASE